MQEFDTQTGATIFKPNELYFPFVINADTPEMRKKMLDDMIKKTAQFNPGYEFHSIVEQGTLEEGNYYETLFKLKR